MYIKVEYNNEIHVIPSVPKSFDELIQFILQTYKDRLPNPFYIFFKENSMQVSNNSDYFHLISTLDPHKNLRLLISSTSSLPSSPRPKNVNKSSSSLLLNKSTLTSNNNIFESNKGNCLQPTPKKVLIDFKIPMLLTPPSFSNNNQQVYEIDIKNPQMTSSLLLENNEAPKSDALKNSFENMQSNQNIMVNNEESTIPCFYCNQDHQFQNTKCNGTGVLIESPTIKLFESIIERKLMGMIPILTEKILEALNSKHTTTNQKPKDNLSTHLNFICNGCGRNPIIGNRYQCLVCPDFDFCESCEEKQEHTHPFIKIKDPRQAPASISFNQVKPITLEDKKRSEFLPNDNNKNFQHSNTLPEKTIPVMKNNLTKDKIDIENEKFPKYKAKMVKVPSLPIENVNKGKPYSVDLIIKNSGKTKWPENTKFKCVEGFHKGIIEKVGSIEAEEQRNLCIQLIAPEWEGKFSSIWRLVYEQEKEEKIFGPKIQIDLKIEGDNDVKKKNTIKWENAESLKNLIINNLNHINFLIALELMCNKETYEKAKMIKEIFNGDIKEYIALVKNANSNLSIDQLIDMHLNNKK